MTDQDAEKETRGEKRAREKRKQDLVLGLVFVGAGALLVILNTGIFGFRLAIAGLIGIEWIGWPTMGLGAFILFKSFRKKPEKRGLG